MAFRSLKNSSMDVTTDYEPVTITFENGFEYIGYVTNRATACIFTKGSFRVPEYLNNPANISTQPHYRTAGSKRVSFAIGCQVFHQQNDLPIDREYLVPKVYRVQVDTKDRRGRVRLVDDPDGLDKTLRHNGISVDTTSELHCGEMWLLRNIYYASILAEMYPEWLQALTPVTQNSWEISIPDTALAVGLTKDGTMLAGHVTFEETAKSFDRRAVNSIMIDDTAVTPLFVAEQRLNRGLCITLYSAAYRDGYLRAIFPKAYVVDENQSIPCYQDAAGEIQRVADSAIEGAEVILFVRKNKVDYEEIEPMVYTFVPTTDGYHNLNLGRDKTKPKPKAFDNMLQLWKKMDELGEEITRDDAHSAWVPFLRAIPNKVTTSEPVAKVEKKTPPAKITMKSKAVEFKIK